jgi:hypothetical protein
MPSVIERLRRAMPLWQSAEQVARAIVAASLGTETGGHEAPSLAARLRHDPAQLQAVLGELLSRPETAARHAPGMLRSLMGELPATDIVGLGTHCFTASLLRRWGLRGWSGPFDWLFSTVPMITHCLEDDFKMFLDRAHYEPVPKELRPHGPDTNRVHHATYRRMFGVDYVFNHHDAHLDEHHAYFVRCVDRLRAQLSSPRPTVYVAARALHSGGADEVRALGQAIGRRRGGPFTLLVFEVPHQGPAQNPLASLELTCDEDGTRVYTYRPVSNWLPLNFENLLDEHILVNQIVETGHRLLSR